jgi:glycolate oxidase iron-sulfur subunit
MPLAYGRVHAATVQCSPETAAKSSLPSPGLLRRASWTQRRLANCNEARSADIDAFLAENFDAVIVNSAGCGSAMKEYGELLANDPEYSHKAHALARIVKDVSEFLVELPLSSAQRARDGGDLPGFVPSAHAQPSRLRPDRSSTLFRAFA